MHRTARPAAALLAAVLLVLGPVLVAPPALAHESDPRIVTTIGSVEPELPAAVVVQVQAGIATQLVASNPTATVLEVLGAQDRPFLRLSAAGVFADVATDDFFTTSNPNGAAPPRPAQAAPRWVQISDGDSWGWYDHRLHPDQAAAPADEERPAELASFTIPLRYGTDRVEVRGQVAFRPLLGSFLVSADDAPQGLTVQALPGRLPGVFLTAPAGTTVLGRDGEPFVRFTADGVEVNTRSRTHVEDRAARGEVAGPPSPEPDFELVGPGARSYTWLDTRLRYPQDLPPEQALRRAEPTVVQTWAVPVLLGGAGTTSALTGDVTWVPEASAAERVGGSAREGDEGPALLPYALAGAGLLLVAGGLAARRRSRAQRPG